MLRFLAVLATCLNLSAADDLSLKALTQKGLDQAVDISPLLGMERSTNDALVCAIPLKEFRAGRSSRIDPIGKPLTPVVIDKMARPAPIQACPKR